MTCGFAFGSSQHSRSVINGRGDKGDAQPEAAGAPSASAPDPAESTMMAADSRAERRIEATGGKTGVRGGWLALLLSPRAPRVGPWATSRAQPSERVDDLRWWRERAGGGLAHTPRWGPRRSLGTADLVSEILAANQGGLAARMLGDRSTLQAQGIGQSSSGL